MATPLRSRDVLVVVLNRRPPQTPEGGPNPGGTTKGAPQGGKRTSPPRPGTPEGNPPQEGGGAGGAQGGPTRPGQGPHKATPDPGERGRPRRPRPKRREEGGTTKQKLVRTPIYHRVRSADPSPSEHSQNYPDHSRPPRPKGDYEAQGNWQCLHSISDHTT